MSSKRPSLSSINILQTVRGYPPVTSITNYSHLYVTKRRYQIGCDNIRIPRSTIYSRTPSSTSYWHPSILPTHYIIKRFIRTSIECISSRVPEENIHRLTEELFAIQNDWKAHALDQQEKDNFLKSLESCVNRFLPHSIECKVEPFGSAVNGFWSPDSDIDVCITIHGYQNRYEQIKLLSELATVLSSITTHVVIPRFSAVIPIIHWKPKCSTEGMLAADISVNNNLAIHNSNLIGAYVSIDERLRTLGIALKYWCRRRGINDRSSGTMSSFSLLLMLIHFLQRRHRPVLPSLQDLAIENDRQRVLVQGVDCRYETDKESIERELMLMQQRGGNEEKPGELLVQFFKYFGYEYKFGIIATRDISFAECVKTGRDTNLLRNTFLHVDNPFEIGKDVANVIPSQHVRIRLEFRRAVHLLQQGMSFKEICESD